MTITFDRYDWQCSGRLDVGTSINDGGAVVVGDSTRLAAELLDLVHDIHTLGDLAKDDVLAIEPAGLGNGDEELGAVPMQPKAISKVHLTH